MKKVQVIPATLQNYTEKPIHSQKKRRVAGYARVSTDRDEQLTSYEAQVDYYTNYIKGRSDWEFAGMYTDEGISATNTLHREGLKSMIRDAMDGRIDLIITKSVSRFARNTVDSLTIVRKLRDKGVEIYFEKENIWTLDAKGELLITIMSSLAQEESRSISENVTWGHRKRFADGKVSLAFSHFLGYDRGADGNLVVNKEQAETVKLIYRLYLSGYTFHSIAKKLTEQKIPTPARCKIWRPNTVRSILMNEKYKGDALLQKKFTVDFLTKKVRETKGKYRNIMCKITMRLLSVHRYLTWYRKRCGREKIVKFVIAVSPFSPAKSNVDSAAVGTEPKFGTRLINTARPYIAVMISSRDIVRRHI